MKYKSTLFIIASALVLGSISAQETTNEALIHDGESRQYVVYVPAIYDESTPVPLMFNFHGYIGNSQNHMEVTAMREVADTAGFILIYPQGSLLDGKTHWNVGAWTIGSTADDLGFTEAMIDTLAEKYNIDLERVYSCGFSNGGYFSFELACKLSNRIAAIGSVGGKMSSQTFNSCDPSHPTPVVTIHGTSDNIVGYYGTNPSGSKTVSEVNTYWANYNNIIQAPVVQSIPNTNIADGSTVDYFSFRDGDNCTSVDHYKVNGGGHDWVGSWGNKDIDASTVIWNFVSQYDINGLIDCSKTSSTANVGDRKITVIYPNPTSDFLTVKSDVTIDVHYQIYSVTGKLIVSGKLTNGTTRIDLKGIPSNVYFLKVGDEVSKVVKTD